MKADTPVRALFDEIHDAKLTKDEFETTAVYVKRRDEGLAKVRSALEHHSGMPMVVGTVKPSGLDIRYDADAGLLRFKAGQYSRGVVGLHSVYIGGGDFSMAVTDEARAEDKGSYVAKNAFGAEVIVSKFLHRWSGFGLRASSYRPPAWMTIAAPFDLQLDAGKPKHLKITSVCALSGKSLTPMPFLRRIRPGQRFKHHSNERMSIASSRCSPSAQP